VCGTRRQHLGAGEHRGHCIGAALLEGARVIGAHRGGQRVEALVDQVAVVGENYAIEVGHS
jgi:hypothetical protein